MYLCVYLYLSLSLYDCDIVLGFLLLRANNNPNQENYHSENFFSIIFTKIQAYLRGIIGSVPDYHNKVKFTIKQVLLFQCK